MGLFREFITSDEAPDPIHSNFYGGDLNFHCVKWGMVLSPELIVGTLVVWFVATGEFALPAYLILRNSLLWFVGGTIAVRFLAYSFAHRSTIHMYPEFALTEQYLWYRFARRWHRLAWSEIKAVRSVRDRAYLSGRGGHIPAGILIYSDALSADFASFALDLDRAPRNVGRAIPVPLMLPELGGLEYVVNSRIKQQQAARKENVSHF